MGPEPRKDFHTIVKIVHPVASIPALLAMKVFALGGRKKDKDAYDVCYCVRNYEGGVKGLVAVCCL